MRFGWDTANRQHITNRRNIRADEVEDAILDPNAVLARAYSVERERREAIVGSTRAGRLLFAVYTEYVDDDGEEIVRPLQARNANRREQRDYEGR